MAKVRTVAPPIPTPPGKITTVFVAGGVYTEHGSTYFMMESNSKFPGRVLTDHRYFCLVATFNGKQTTGWMSKEEMSKHLNKKDKNYIFRPNAEVVIPLDPWETGI